MRTTVRLSVSVSVVCQRQCVNQQTANRVSHLLCCSGVRTAEECHSITAQPLIQIHDVVVPICSSLCVCCVDVHVVGERIVIFFFLLCNPARSGRRQVRGEAERTQSKGKQVSTARERIRIVQRRRSIQFTHIDATWHNGGFGLLGAGSSC